MTPHIVIIDNEPNMRDMLTLCFHSEGWQASAYSFEAINTSALQSLHPALIVLDFSLRDEQSGWNLLQLLKMDDKFSKVPVVITTSAFQLSAEMRHYLLTRHISVVVKPFDLNSFLMLIHNTLSLASQADTIFTSDRALPILVVDDFEELRDNITTVLGMEGYGTSTAENGLEALKSLALTEHCLILLDIEMPIMDGFEFIRTYDQQLRPHSPVVVLSAGRTVGSQVLPKFVVEFLPKPFELKRLIKVVARYARLA